VNELELELVKMASSRDRRDAVFMIIRENRGSCVISWRDRVPPTPSRPKRLKLDQETAHGLL
jgi:hypothetical protein